MTLLSMVRVLVLVLACAAAPVLACSSAESQRAAPSTGTPGAAAGGAQSCQERKAAAQQQVQAAIDAGRQCATDADCTTVAFATLCFDSCTRAVSSSGAAAVQQAIQQANTTICASYRSDACPFVVPPCAPPEPPACRKGLCE